MPRLEGVPQAVRLLGKVDKPDLPQLGELGRQQRTVGTRVRLIDHAEIRFETIQDSCVGAQKCLFTVEHGLEHRLPPREFKLLGHPLGGNVSHRQVFEQRLKVEFAQAIDDRHAFLEVGQHLGIGCERTDRIGEFGNRQGVEGRRSSGRLKGGIEQHHVFHHPLIRGTQITHPDGHFGQGAGNGVPLPHHALLLNAHERRVHVGNAGSGTNKLGGKFAQVLACRRWHVMPTSTGGRRNHVVERTVENVGHKGVKRVSDVDEKANVQAEFDEVLKRAHARLAHHLVGALEQARQVDGVDALGQIVARLRFRVVREGDAVPRRIVGAITELPQFGG